MIGELIDYLINLPSPSTSPLAVALNVTDLKEAISDPVKTINLIDTRNSEMDLPYIRLWDTEETNILQEFVAGGKRCYIEQLFMGVECSANGPSASVARSRVDYLRLAAEGAIQPLISTFSPSDLPGRTDLAGSGATDEIKRVIIDGGRSNPPIMGPGTEDSELWTATRNFRVEVWVYRNRG